MKNELWDQFYKHLDKSNWRLALVEYKNVIEKKITNDLAWENSWADKIDDIWRRDLDKSERLYITAICERMLAYTRKLLINARKHNQARKVFPKQMKYRRFLDWLNGDYWVWFQKYVYWLTAGYQKTYPGLIRLLISSIFFVNIFVLIPCAATYRFPHPRLEYVPTVYKESIKLEWFHYIYFSAMALTTVGYGDIHPKPLDKIGIFLSVGEAMVGYILLGIFIGLFVHSMLKIPAVDGPPLDDFEGIFSKLK